MKLLIEVPFILFLLLGQALPVAKIEVKGAERHGAEQIVQASGLKVGEPAAKAEVAAAAERLMATGWFARVNYRLQPGPEGLAVTFTVVEKPAEAEEPAPAPPGPKIGSVTFTGTNATPSGVLWAALKPMAEGREYEEADFRHMLESLLRPVFGERGVWKVKFGAITAAGGDPVHLTVDVEEGPALTLGGVTLEGADERWVAEARFPLGLTANQRQIEEAFIRLRHRAAREGYLRAGITAVEQFQGSEVNLQLRLERGEQFRFGQLRIQGLNAAAEARARKMWTARPGTPANPDAVEMWIKAVFDARLPKGTNVLRQLVHRENEPVVDVEVDFR